MGSIDVEKIGVRDLEKGVFDEVLLLKVAEQSNDSAVLARLAGHGNCIVRCAVAGNKHIGKEAVDVLENDRDSGVVRVLVVNPTYLAMKKGEVIDITNAVSSRVDGVNLKK